MSRNPRTTFELISLTGSKKIEEAHQWCLNNLPLTDGAGIRYEGSVLFIITSSQKIIDKINNHFGSQFCFRSPKCWGITTYYI